MAECMINRRNIEMREGEFEWKISRFLEQDKVSSTVFRFGRYESVLLLQKFDEYYDFVLQIHELCGKDIFRELTYYKASIISSDGDEYFSVLGSIQKKQQSITVMHFFDENQKDESSEEDPEGKSSKDDHENEYDYLTEGILKFRLSWSFRRFILDHTEVLDKTCPTTNHAISGTDHMELSNKLLKGIHALRFKDTNYDCVLKLGDKQFSVHRDILSARSKVFAAMFRQEMIENSSGVVEIQDIEADVLDDILHYVYTGNIRTLNGNNAASMFAAAEKFALVELRKVCLKILIHNLTVVNVSDAIALAHVHKLSVLKKIILKFFENNSAKLVKTNEWKKFSKTEPCLAIQYLQSALISVTEKLKSKK